LLVGSETGNSECTIMIPSSISDYLDRNQARYSVVSHPVAYTAQEEAAATHVPGGEWAKAVVCLADDQPILAVLPAPFVVDLHRLQRAVNAHSVRLAREPEFATLYKDCELGAIPPLGPLYGQRVFIDKKLTADSEITFSAGSHHDAIRMPYREFERLVQPAVAEFAAGPSAASSQRTATPR
jgi:Ala-tRNA(Pro) deacylase